jgi:CheY-like chemotaxis protein
MSGRGTLTISCGNRAISARMAAAGTHLDPGDYVFLEVHDSGPGMPPEVQAHLFEPFFTTKSAGTGLGLATVYGIVMQASGRIWVESSPASGTRFTLAFPRSSGSVPPSPAAPDGFARGGCERILVVEDNADVRALVTRVLEEAGYSVEAAGNGRAALDLANLERPFRLLLTDIVMPEMGGPALADQLMRSQPELKVLFVSAHPSDFTEGADESVSGTFLQKPFTGPMLLRKVRELLDTSV